MLGMSSIMGSINIITTILNMRAPGMTLMKMPMFCWTWLITAYLLIAVMPVLAGAVTMTLTDRHFGTTFLQRGRWRRPGAVPAHFLVLRPPRGVHHRDARLRRDLAGDPGVLAQAAVRLRLDGLRDASIAILSFIVWAHHMYTAGMPVTASSTSCTQPC
jgi:cytochrome c oxidase subunit 1